VTNYDDLVTAATIGLDRRPIGMTGLPAPASAYEHTVDRTDPAAALLDAAALLTAARRAGHLPATITELPEPAAPDARPSCRQPPRQCLRGCWPRATRRCWPT
jgi:hypothetical protein